MRVIHIQQIADFALVDLDVFRIAFVLHVRGANDGELIHPRDHKHDALVFVLQDIGLLLGMYPRHHDMAAFNQANAIRRWQLHALVEELLHPWAGSVHQTARLPAETLAGIDVFCLDDPQSVFPASGDRAGTGFHLAAFAFNHLRVSEHQAGIVHPAVGIFESAHDFRLKHRVCAKTHTRRGGQTGTFTQVIVHKQTNADHPRRTQMRAVWQTKTHWRSDMGGHFQQHFTLGQRLTDQAELVVFQITQATVDQLRAGGGGGTGEILRFQHQDR